MGDNIENEYYRFKYICSLSDEDKIGNLDSLLSEKLKALVIASLASDTLKERLLDTLSGIYVKSFVISSFKSDEAKLKYLNKLNKSTKALVIASFRTDELKKKYFSCVTSDKDKAVIIKNFISDEYKLWGIDTIKKEENKIPLIATLKSVENMTLALSKIEDYAIKLDILNSLSDIAKESYLDTDLDYLDKMALVYTLRNVELKSKWIAKLEYPMDFDLGIDPKLQFGLEIECEGALNTYFCNLWTDKSSYLATMDATLMQGLEVKTPPIHNTTMDLENLYYVFNVLNKAGFTSSNRCGGHIHFDKNYLETKEEYMALFEIWSYAEEIFYLIGNAEGDVPRGYVTYFTKPFLDGILDALKEGIVYQDLKKSDEEFIQCLSFWQETKNNSLNFHHQNKKLNTMEFRVSNGSMSFIIWMQNIKLFGRLLMISKALGNIHLNQATEDEKKLWNLKEGLKQDISLEEKLEVLLELLFSEDEKEVYRNRYYANSRLLEKNNSLESFEFYGIDMSRILKR